MSKIITIANREYRAMVGTKAFVISIVMMPILMFAGLVAMEVLKDVGQTQERKIAVIDHSAECFEVLNEVCKKRNERLRALRQTSDPSQLQPGAEFPGITEETYLFESIDAETADDELLFQLSERIRNQDLYAIVVIPAQIFDPAPNADNKVRFFAEDSSISLARRWINDELSRLIRNRRFEDSGLNEQELENFRRLNQEVVVLGRGLMERGSDGVLKASEEKNLMTTLFLPMGIMMLMFMVIFMASQPMLESVLEEKSQRIAEVLLGSANPFQLMMGKLLGTVAGSLTVFAIYLGGVYSIAAYRDWTENIPLEIVPWFLVFQITGVLFYSAIFMSVGASVSQLKEAQSMLLPVWMLLMAPMFVWFIIVRDPQGPMAMGLSFFPPTAPTTMVLRLATGQSIAIWQPIVALLVTLVATIVMVILAGRIFRVGILWQGKTPKVSEILMWAIGGR